MEHFLKILMSPISDTRKLGNCMQFDNNLMNREFMNRGRKRRTIYAGEETTITWVYVFIHDTEMK